MTKSDFRIALHAKLDRDCDEKRKSLENKLIALDKERKQGHEWIDSAPEAVLRAFVAGSEAVAPAGAMQIAESRRVPLYEPIKSIVGSIDPQHEISSPIIFDALLQAIPSLEYENEWKLKARIAATLSSLVDEDVLKLKKAGRGSAPHVYIIRNPPYKPVIDAFSGGGGVRARKK